MVSFIKSQEAGAGPPMPVPSDLKYKNPWRSKSFMSFGKGSLAREYLTREEREPWERPRPEEQA